jgi:hypothetical protein
MTMLNQDGFFTSAYIPEPNSGCWLWLRALNVDGYGSIAVGRASTKNGNERAHRFSWKKFKGAIPFGMCVLHRCDVRSCVNPDHLFLGTYRDNHDDMVAKGRRGRTGGTNPKLTASSAAAIRSRPNDSLKDLAAEYGVSRSLVCMVRRGSRWRGDR